MRSSRFQIEEIVSQDAHGAVFLAMDAESGCEVLLQRFFPFGAGEGGLEGDELSSYDQAILRMRELEHPNLRRVICGGCDPVDGIPFMVTQTRSAMSLREFLPHGVLNASQGLLLAESALELLIWLEQTFGHPADWLALQTSDVEMIGEGVSFRFCVDPMKWLGLRLGSGAVKELAALVEECMGWRGRVVTGSTAGMLSGWVRLAKTRDMTFEQALTALRGGQIEPCVPTPAINPLLAPAPVATAVASDSYRSPTMSARAGSHALWYVFGSLVVAAAMSLVGIKWYQVSHSKSNADAVAAAADQKTSTRRKKATNPSSPVAVAVPVEKTRSSASDEQKVRAQIEQRARELQKGTSATSVKSKDTDKKVPKREGDYSPEEHKAIGEQVGEKISVKERVAQVRLSNSGKSLYIEFRGDAGASQSACGRYFTNLGVPGMSVSELSGLQGKTVRIQGVVGVEFGTNRLIIDLTSREQITLLDAP